MPIFRSISLPNWNIHKLRDLLRGINQMTIFCIRKSVHEWGKRDKWDISTQNLPTWFMEGPNAHHFVKSTYDYGFGVIKRLLKWFSRMIQFFWNKSQKICGYHFKWPHISQNTSTLLLTTSLNIFLFCFWS